MSPQSADSTPSYQNFLNRLVPALRASGPDSPDVLAQVQAGKQQFSGQATDIDALLRVWRDMSGTAAPAGAAAPAEGSGATGSPWGSLASHGGTLTVGILATLGLAYRDEVSHFFDATLQIPLSPPWVLLAVVAVAGAVGGFVNGYLARSGAVLPSFQELGGARYFLPGLLGNAAAGAVAAGLTVWAPTWAAGAPAEGGASAVARPVMHMSAVVVSAFVAGLGAARMVTGQRDKNLLWYAVVQALGQPSRPATALRASNARSTQEVVAMTTGDVLPGVSATSAANPADLLRHFNSDGLRRYFEATGRPAALTRDTQDLDLSVLNVVQGVGGPLRDAVRDLRLADVAASNLETFRASLAAAGVDVAALGPLVEVVWKGAREARAALGQLPPDGRLTPEQLAR